ncbi:MAG: hypothetical protein ACR2NP_16090 [Pirellulaceae bacterium]
MEFIAGNSLILVIIGVVITLILAAMYLGTHDRRVLPFVAVGGLFIVVPIIIDYGIETPEETLQKRVRQLARHVRQNDVPGALEFFDPKMEPVRNRMMREMPQYDFSLCNVTGTPSVKFTNESKTTAKVKFVVAFNLAIQGQQQMGLRGVTLEFRKTHDGHWLITHYRHYHPIATGPRDNNDD